MPNSKNKLIYMFLVIISLISLKSYALPQYTVEILVLKKIDTTDEVFPLNFNFADFDNSIELKTYNKKYSEQNYMLYPYAKRKLDYYKYLLNKSGKFTALIHKKWQQGISNDSSFKVALHSKEKTNRPRHKSILLKQPAPKLKPHLNIWCKTKIRSLGPAKEKSTIIQQLFCNKLIEEDLSLLEGTIKLYINRYVFTELDLWLYENENHYQLKQHKKIKSKELHYFEHPKIVALLVITPIR